MNGRWRGPIFSKSARPLTRTPRPITSNTAIAPRWAVFFTPRRRQPRRAPFRSRERSIARPGTTISRSPTFRRRSRFSADNFSSQIYGSAAADWARWPAGTIFRVLSTGQLYRVEDYGWALSGRNTIDLYMATPRDMNGWGVRQELIQIVHWGDAQESLRRLAPHTKYRHIKRMVLELEGHERAAANLD